MMPFPIVRGTPGNTPRATLKKLRADLITAVAEEMGVKPSTVRPFFPGDLIGDPSEGEDDTIFVTIATGMFFGKPNTEEAKKKVTSRVAKLVFDAFNGRYEVEVFIDHLDPEGKTLLKPKGKELPKPK